jgi:hypothetical protein
MGEIYDFESARQIRQEEQRRPSIPTVAAQEPSVPTHPGINVYTESMARLLERHARLLRLSEGLAGVCTAEGLAELDGLEKAIAHTESLLPMQRLVESMQQYRI